MLLPAYNPPLDELEVTYLSNPEAAGTTSHTVRNNNSFAANDRVMFGAEGTEPAEIVSVTSISGGNTIVTGATVFAHNADDPITRLRFDQIKLYRSTTGVSGTYTLLATYAIDVDNEDRVTTYDDTTGTAAYFYKFTYYNSSSTLESDYSDPIQGSGYDRGSVGFLIDEVLREVADENEQFTSRTELLSSFNEVNDDLINSVKRPYDFLRARTTMTRTANTNYIDFPTDSNGNQIMWKFDRIDYSFTDSATTPVTNILYPMRVVSLTEFREKYQDQTVSGTSTSDEIKILALDTAVSRFRFWPASTTTATNVFYLYYWKYFDELTSEGDILETPTPRIYKLYAKGMFYRKKAAKDISFMTLSDRFMQDYLAEKIKLRKGDGKDQGSPKGFVFSPQTFKGNRGF